MGDGFERGGERDVGRNVQGYFVMERGWNCEAVGEPEDGSIRLQVVAGTHLRL